ncbi:hypothetical protein F1559_000103 [Cyanidiococcus yangmingshanensis]|uniref:FAD-binding domain-containing protein n=1 Tax=Cyanidiococcus yangmingshanensis TaxID=2690220 RepID=A0A7J7IF43_9RHOD|nr:hypothetical protein F1559_000103 [Cyanidiococcus yangmingshanensis]
MGYGIRQTDDRHILQKTATQVGAALRVTTKVISLRVVEDGISGWLVGFKTAETTLYRCDYLVAGDVARSSARQELCIEREELDVLSHYISVMVEADIRPVIHADALHLYHLQD